MEAVFIVGDKGHVPVYVVSVYYMWKQYLHNMYLVKIDVTCYTQNRAQPHIFIGSKPYMISFVPVYVVNVDVL